MFELALMRRFSFALACTIAILGFSTNSSAQESTTRFPYLAKVIQEQVAVRAGADSRYYLFGQISEDDYVQVVSHKSGWARVRAYGPVFKDFYGYVKLPKSETRRFLVNSESKTGLTNGSVDIFGPNLDDKAEPARSWKPIARLTSPTKLKILGAESTDSLLIFKVELPRESEGWINLTNLRTATIDEITSWENFVAQANKPQPVVAAKTNDNDDNKPSSIAAETTQQPPSIAANEIRTVVDETANKTVEANTLADTPTSVAIQTPSRKTGEKLTMGEAGSSTDKQENIETPTRVTQTNRSITQSISRIAAAIADTDNQINRPATTSDKPELPNQILGTNLDPINPARITPSVTRPSALNETNQQTQQGEINIASSPLQLEVKPQPQEKPKVYISMDDVRGLSLEDLEAMYSRLLREPKQTAEVDPLQQMYTIYAAKFAKEGVETSHAKSRAAQLEIWAELQQRMVQIQDMRSRAKAGVKEADAATITLENSGDYQAVGILISSTIYDGNRLPKLFRLRDQITGRTIGYIAPSEDFKLAEMIGKVIGIKGERSYDGGLRLNVFTPQKIDILTNSQ